MSRLACGVAALLLIAGSIASLSAEEPKFTPQFLQNEQEILKGRQVFLIRCTYCHAKKGIGKAPVVRPTTRTPEFIYERITQGFQGMPAWVSVLPQDQREALVAYLMSDPDKY